MRLKDGPLESTTWSSLMTFTGAVSVEWWGQKPNRSGLKRIEGEEIQTRSRVWMKKIRKIGGF